MALEADPPWLGDIGDHEPEADPDPDRVYEARIESRIHEAQHRPEDCGCWPGMEDLPCWPCWRDGFAEPNPDPEEDE